MNPALPEFPRIMQDPSTCITATRACHPSTPTVLRTTPSARAGQHTIGNSAIIKGELSNEAVSVSRRQAEHECVHGLGNVLQPHVAVIDARGRLASSIDHLRVEKGIGIALGWIVPMRTRRPPDTQIVDCSLEILVVFVLAQRRRAADDDLSQA